MFGEVEASEILGIATHAARDRPRVHRSELFQCTDEPRHIALIAEIPPPGSDGCEARGLHEVLGLVVRAAAAAGQPEQDVERWRAQLGRGSARRGR